MSTDLQSKALKQRLLSSGPCVTVVMCVCVWLLCAALFDNSFLGFMQICPTPERKMTGASKSQKVRIRSLEHS